MSKAGDRIIQGAREALAYARGEATDGFQVHVPARIDVRTIRERTGLSQARFARSIGVQVTTLRNWEQGRRDPDGPARVLLSLIEKRPTIVLETLGTVA